jgi:hypothetical protein
MPIVEYKFKKLKKTVLSLLQSWGKKEVLVIGDSHSKIFMTEHLRSAFPAVYFDVHYVSGATASGLANPRSQTQAYTKFQRTLSRSKAKQVIVQLGEVDTGYVIWYRSQKYGESVESMLSKAVETYSDFLKQIQAANSSVICISAPLPTIQDGATWGEVAHARREIVATQLQRTQLTLQFNQKISEVCASQRIHYINLDNESMGDDLLIRQDLLNKKPTDHHYDDEAYAALLKKQLLPLL